ncbi:MAG: hypothetical protein ABIJ92_02645 [Candidatus Aenigmatarchaeota archaeon]
MALTDLTGILSFMPDLLRELPTMFFVAFVVGYIFLILFLGSIAVKGYRGYTNIFFHFIFRIGLGFAALIAGISLSEFLPFLNEGIYKTFQINVFMGGLIAAFILLACVYMISIHVYNIQGIKNKIASLQATLKKAASIQGKQKLTPVSIIGVVILVGFLLFAAVTFQGFPDPLADLGITAEELSTLADEIETISGGDLPAGCPSMAQLSSEFGLNMLAEEFDDPQASTLMETNSGGAVLQTYRVNYQGTNVILGITADNSLCSVANNQFCECISV